MSRCAHPLSCCAQSQHPERPVERSEPEVPGFRDCARNDEVEGPTLCGEHRNVTLRRLVQYYGNIVTACRLAVNDRKHYI